MEETQRKWRTFGRLTSSNWAERCWEKIPHLIISGKKPEETATSIFSIPERMPPPDAMKMSHWTLGQFVVLDLSASTKGEREDNWFSLCAIWKGIGSYDLIERPRIIIRWTWCEEKPVTLQSWRIWIAISKDGTRTTVASDWSFVQLSV